MSLFTSLCSFASTLFRRYQLNDHVTPNGNKIGHASPLWGFHRKTGGSY